MLTQTVYLSNCSKDFSLFFCLQLLQQNLETNFYSGHFSWDEVSPNDAAALLKKFIRELPAPLLTAEYLNTFSAVRGQWSLLWDSCLSCKSRLKDFVTTKQKVLNCCF